MAIKVYRTSADLYIGTPLFRPGLDKWWRLRISAVGPIDLYGERLLSANTSLATFSKNYLAGTILTNGGEESPAFRIPTGFVGGNHTVPGGSQKSIFGYQMSVAMDGKSVPSGQMLSGLTLTLTEKYYVRTVTNGSAVAEIIITRSFTSAHQFSFIYKMRVLAPFDLTWFGGLQSQLPKLLNGDTLSLRIPGAVAPWGSANGNDITALATETHFGPSTWLNANSPPIRFERIVKRAGAPQFTVVQGFSSGSQYRGTISDAFMYSAAKKAYAIGVMFDPARRMVPGEEYRANGYYGCYNGH